MEANYRFSKPLSIGELSKIYLNNMETTKLEPKNKLWRDERHSHFWIEDNELYESYHTIRGLRFRSRLAVKDLPDTEKCSDEMILFIEMEYLN